MDRNKFIDDLIAAGARDDEIAEALELAESRGEFGQQPSGGTRQQPAEPSQQKRVLPPNYGTPGTYSAPSVDVGPSYQDRVNADIERQAQKDYERQKQGGNKNLSEIAGKMQSMAAPIRQAPGAYELGQVFGGTLGAAAQKVAPKNGVPEGNRGPGMTFGSFTPPIVDPAKVYAESPNIRSLGDIATASGEILPVASVGGRLGNVITQGTLKGTENILKNTGKNILRRDMKPKDVTALLAGKNVEDGAKAIADNVDKYGVASTTGGFTGIAKNASRKINENMKYADDAIKKVAEKMPDAKIDIDESFLNFIDDLETGKINSVFGNEERAASIADNIHKALELRGLTGTQGIEKIPEIKRAVENYAGGLFKKGKYAIESDPIPKQVGELVYLKMKKDLESVVPEIKQYNTAVHDLITVKKAANEAAKRIGNRDNISITDWMLLFGGPTAAHSLGLPSAAAGAIPGAAMIGKKALGSGRGASGLMKLGDVVEGTRKILGTDIMPSRTSGSSTLGNILNNERGAIAGVSDDFVGTPAIMDPETGSLYTGNWRGHKGAIAKGETSAIQERLKQQHFIDNSGKPTQYVGFIDKHGNFLSRAEAERQASIPRSPVAMFHTLGATAGAAGGGLTLGAILKNKQEK